MTSSYTPRLGPHAVGVADGELTDADYPIVLERDAAGRRLMVRVWYPAVSAEGSGRSYLDNGDEDVVRAFLDNAKIFPASWIDLLREVKTFSAPEAAPANGPFPTLIFSHGAFSYVGQNTPLMEHLASHGYVVWSVGHTSGAAAVRFPDGTLELDHSDFMTTLVSQPIEDAIGKVQGDPADRLMATKRYIERDLVGPWARRWVDDIRAVINAIERSTIHGPASALVSNCDQDRIGVLGMSFGAGAAVSAAQCDERVKGIVNIDGGQNLGDVLDAHIRLPMLYISHDFTAGMAAKGMDDLQVIDYNEFFFEPASTLGDRSDIYRLRIPLTAHIELTDIALIPVEERHAALPGGGAVESQRIVDILNSLTKAYFDNFLLGQANGFPAAQLDQFPEVVKVDITASRVSDGA